MVVNCPPTHTHKSPFAYQYIFTRSYDGHVSVLSNYIVGAILNRSNSYDSMEITPRKLFLEL